MEGNAEIPKQYRDIAREVIFLYTQNQWNCSQNVHEAIGRQRKTTWNNLCS